MVALLPRLPALAADRLLDRFLSRDVGEWPSFNPDHLPSEIRFAATGGSPVKPDQLREIHSGLMDIAGACGFEQGKTRGRQFDWGAAIWLAQTPLLDSGEALRDDVWSFVGVVMAPDIVRWRFGGARERYLGGVRNTFQRLWMRAKVLDRREGVEDRWGLLQALTEDAFVQIIERPSIGGDPMLARELAEAWRRASGRHGREVLEPLMRRVALRVRVLNEIRSLSSLGDAELACLLDDMFDAEFQALRRNGGAA